MQCVSQVLTHRVISAPRNYWSLSEVEADINLGEGSQNRIDEYALGKDRSPSNGANEDNNSCYVSNCF